MIRALHTSKKERTLADVTRDREIVRDSLFNYKVQITALMLQIIKINTLRIITQESTKLDKTSTKLKVSLLLQLIQFWSHLEKGRKSNWWLCTLVHVLINQIIIEYKKQCIKNYCPKSSLILIFKLRFQYNFNFRLLKKKWHNDFRDFSISTFWIEHVAFKIKIQSYSISTRNFINPKVLTQTLWFINMGIINNTYYINTHTVKNETGIRMRVSSSIWKIWDILK